MNYRHAFHAGNFADVFKHVLLTHVVAYLKQKERPFFYLDSHAGTGTYDLTSGEALRTGEWRNGIGRVMEAAFSPEVTLLLQPYLDCVAAFQQEAGHGLSRYPGSPALVALLARPDDRLVFNELHPADAATLQDAFRQDHRVHVAHMDGYKAIKAHIPPRERRGFVLVDPPFEVTDEFEQMTKALQVAHAKWPTGTYIFWYPIKDLRRTDLFMRQLEATGIDKILRLELMVQPATDVTRLNGCGLIVVNPPWVLLDVAATMLGALTEILAQSPEAHWRAGWLVPERRAAKRVSEE
jgi:23S rRNA (adenine2030-N6)-methyltransferase